MILLLLTVSVMLSDGLKIGRFGNMYHFSIKPDLMQKEPFNDLHDICVGAVCCCH